MQSDQELHKEIMEELKWEAIHNSSEIGVTVKNGIVMLSGNVDTYAKKEAAERAALRVAGVKVVAEDIIVQPDIGAQRSDMEITDAILYTFKWHGIVQEDRIKLKVDNGCVTLEGELDWTYQRDAVKKTVENIMGVKGIINNITLSPRVSRIDVKKKISAAFHHIATIDADNITIETLGNIVILHGCVRSYAEKRDAEYAAWGARGVTSVENKLEVKVPSLID
jgi:osmotically-inducible protein OsmY